MAFDLSTFEAEVALKLILTHQLPAVAQDALEAGFEGPHVVRMAILDPVAGWEVDQALPPMLEELGCKPSPAEEAALRLARLRAQHILNTGQDPLTSVPYFAHLASKADYPEELLALASLDDDLLSDVEKRARAHDLLKELLTPELYQKRRSERKAAWEREQTRIKREWPYVLNSASGRALLKKRYLEKIADMTRIPWIEFVAWILIGWAFSSWRAIVIGYAVTLLLMFTLPIWGEYMRMRRERRDTLRVPEDQI